MRRGDLIRLLVLAAALSGCAHQGVPYTTFDAAAQQALTPTAAQQLLAEGNRRFVAGTRLARDYREQVAQTGHGQHPFAAVLACLDSRSAPELLFDQGIGDLFVARLAGNVVTDEVLASFEYATEVAGARLIVVLGHAHCGAVKAACDGVELGHLATLLDHIEPAIARIPPDGQPRTSANPEFVEAVARANVELAVKQLQARSPILAARVGQGQLAIVGALYDTEDGAVHWLETPASGPSRSR
jgi:carbonic anhydrase